MLNTTDDEITGNFQNWLENIFWQHLKVKESADATADFSSYFVKGVNPEIWHLISKQNLDWEIACLSQL